MVGRRRFLKGLAAGGALIVGGGGLYAGTRRTSWELSGTTVWNLHADTGARPLGGLYSGSPVQASCQTAASSMCPGPGRMSAYFGGLYVEDQRRNRLRTGRFVDCGASYAPLTTDTASSRLMRWASATSFEPDYSFAGRIRVEAILPRPPDSPSGLTFHPVHIDNCNNYFLRFWQAANPRRVTFTAEVDDHEPQPYLYDEESLPREPTLGRWYEFQIDVLAGGRFRFFWDEDLVFDVTDPRPQYANGGPVGMRLDYFDALLEGTRVIRR